MGKTGGFMHNLKHGIVRSLVVSLIAAGFLAACASEPPLPEPTSLPSLDARGTLVPRTPSTELFSQLEVHTWIGRYEVSEDGRFHALFPDIDDTRFAFVATRNQPDQPVYFGYYFPEQYDSRLLRPFVDRGEGIVIDARSTALTMTLINPLLFDSTVEQRAMVAEEVLQHKDFDLLVAQIEDLRSLDPTVRISYETTPDLFFISSRILIDSMKTLAERLPDSAPAPDFAPQSGINYDYDMAYPVNEDGGIRIYNPKMAHYAVGLRDPDNEDWDEVQGYTLMHIPGKERVLDISIFPPKIEVVPPTETFITSGSGIGKTMHIYKGFQFDFPFNQLWATPPARMAMVANAWASWNMMMALAGNIAVILDIPGVNFVRYLTNTLTEGQSFANVWETVESRDRESTIDSMYEVFTAVLPAIQEHAEAQARAYYGNISGQNGTLSQITSIFGAVWSLVSGGSIVNAIIDITTQVIPFYWDLFTAHSFATYPVFDNKVQPLPNNPMLSIVQPTSVMNGRNGVVGGFDLGGTPGKLLITGGDGVAKEAEILVWTASAITFKAPEDLSGFDDGSGQQVVFLQVQKANGDTTNTLTAPFVAAVAAEEAAGGGCTAGPGTAADAWGMLVLAVGVLLLKRRRFR